MNDPKKPGYQSTSVLWAVKWPRIRRYIDNHVIPFMKFKLGDTCMDLGEVNPRISYLQNRTALNFDSWSPPDLNFDSIDKEKHYDIITAFDIMEHLQCAMHTLSEMKKSLKDDGSIYINNPCNPRWLWSDEHFFEYPMKHFERWIVNPLGLKVVRKKRIFFIANRKAFFIGVRPLLRVLRGETTWRSMARSIFCWNFYIMEIKKDI